MHHIREISCWYCGKIFLRINIGIKWCCEKCRIMKKIEVDDNCWIWKGGIGKDGYGVSSIKGKSLYAHRHSYLTFIGEIPKGLQVHHKCDNPICCNPDHLWLGTQKENCQDRANKGRNPLKYGVYHHLSKLSNEDVFLIRAMIKKGYQQLKIAGLFGCHSSNISHIARNKRWNHI